jgi:hypothetical protein
MLNQFHKAEYTYHYDEAARRKTWFTAQNILSDWTAVAAKRKHHQNTNSANFSPPEYSE